MPTVKAAQVEVLRGYRLLEPLAPQGPGELWKCAAPGGRVKLARFLPGTPRDLRSLLHLQAVQHPGLIALERVELLAGELLLLRDLAERTLNDLLVEYRAAGRPGLPRAEALAYLRDAAEALDAVARKHGLQHLAVSPRSLTLAERRVRVADFGLAHCLAQRPGGLAEARQLGAFAAPHAAPELLQGEVSPAADQYALAVTYHELVTGEPPAGEPVALGALLPCDRPWVARALARDPAGRFGSSGDFIHALLTAEPGTVIAEIPPVAPVAVSAELRAADPPPAVASEPTVPAAPEVRNEAPPAERPAAPVAPPPDDPTGLAGYRLVECCARSPLGEVWKAEAADGAPCLVRLLFGVDVAEPRPGGSPLDRLRALSHEALAPAEVHSAPGRLILVSAPGKLSLLGRLRRCQSAGLCGIPREELLGYLRATAEAIDALTAAHGLQHLSLTPRQVFVADGRVRLIDYGLAELVWLPAGQQAVALQARYAPPELLQGKVSRAADQYSLACLFQELLLGVHPFRHLSPQDLLAARRPRPDLAMVPAADRPALLRALHPDPEQRFTCCGDFVTALGGLAPAARGAVPASPLAVPQLPAGSSRVFPGRPSPAQVVGELVQVAAGNLEVREFRNIRYVFRPGQAIEHRCFARLLPGTGRLKLEGFRQQWQAQATALSPEHFRFQLPAAGSVWNFLTGRTQGLCVDVVLSQPQGPTETLTEIAVTITPLDPHSEKGARLLEQTGPPVLESLRHFLQAQRERRSQERLPFEAAVQVCPVLPNLQRGTPIDSRSRDISLHGMGLVLPQHPRTAQVAVRLAAQAGGELVSVPGRVVRAVPESDGTFDVGVCFAVPAPPAPGRAAARA
jgi:serine/threonine protein kinase